jgi:hypothetical protein
MGPILVRTLLLAAATLSAACATGRSAGDEGDFRDPVDDALVEVRNQSTSDMRIYVVTEAGQRTRIGFVSGNTTATLRIPPIIVGYGREVRFQADPLAGRSTASSFTHYVRPGETITITIPPQIR